MAVRESKTCPVAVRESKTCAMAVQEDKSFLRRSYFWDDCLISAATTIGLKELNFQPQPKELKYETMANYWVGWAVLGWLGCLVAGELLGRVSWVWPSEIGYWYWVGWTDIGSG